MKIVLQRNAMAFCILLSACAAANTSGAADATTGNGSAFGAFLAAQYAQQQQDPATATGFYEAALQADPGNPFLIDNGFISALLAGSPASAALARQVPGNVLATMLLGNQAAGKGDYAAAQAQYAAIAAGQPGRFAAAASAGLDPEPGRAIPWAPRLNGIVPLAENSPFGAVYILNAALIADNANDMKDAAQLYQLADSGDQAPNLRLAQIMASWLARQGKTDARARRTGANGVNPSQPRHRAAGAARQHAPDPVIRTPADGIAEAYLAIAGSLDQPAQELLRTTFLRFALDAAAGFVGGSAAAGRCAVRRRRAAQMCRSSRSSCSRRSQRCSRSARLTRSMRPAVLQEANLLAASGRRRQAVALLDQLIAVTPGTIDPLQEAGDILRGGGQFSQSISYYDRAIALLPQPPPAGRPGPCIMTGPFQRIRAATGKRRSSTCRPLWRCRRTSLTC